MAICKVDQPNILYNDDLEVPIKGVFVKIFSTLASMLRAGEW